MEATYSAVAAQIRAAKIINPHSGYDCTEDEISTYFEETQGEEHSVDHFLSWLNEER